MKNAEYMTVADVEKYLNISKGAAYSLTRRADFPICRFGGNIRIPKAAFLVWVDKMTTIPNEIRVQMNAA